MKQETNQTYEEENSSREEPRQLYLARLKGEQGTIKLSDEDPQEFALFGDILLAGWGNEGRMPEYIRPEHITLWSEPFEEVMGIVSLAGPANEILVIPSDGGRSGRVEGFQMRLYYSPLSELEPACRDSDAVFPQLEILQGTLVWQVEDVSETELYIGFTIEPLKLVESRLGAIEEFSFGPIGLPFRRVEAQEDTAQKANSLQRCNNSAPPGDSHDQKKLNLRFVNLTRNGQSPTDLEAIIQQLVYGACAVWWQKGGIRLDPEPNIVSPPDPSGYFCHDDQGNTVPGFCVSMGQEISLASIAAVENAVEVYLVDKLLDRDGGGITYHCGSNDAFIILEIDKAAHNHYLLAHELGHVLGLRHPYSFSGAGGGCAGFPEGSPCSVMVADNPNSSRNTAKNLATYSFPLGPVFTTIVDENKNPLGCGQQPDDDPANFYHFVRDFAYDDGSSWTGTLPPELEVQANIWNANQRPKKGLNRKQLYEDNKTPMFKPNHVPNDAPPVRAGPNFMCVRLHACQALGKRVYVNLYLAKESGNQKKLRPLVPLIAGDDYHYHLKFSGTYLPKPGLPITKAVPWTVPGTYEGDVWVFAVCYSDEDIPPEIIPIIENPNHNHDYDFLTNLVSSLNNVSQRKLNFPEIPV